MMLFLALALQNVLALCYFDLLVMGRLCVCVRVGVSVCVCVCRNLILRKDLFQFETSLYQKRYWFIYFP